MSDVDPTGLSQAAPGSSHTGSVNAQVVVDGDTVTIPRGSWEALQEKVGHLAEWTQRYQFNVSTNRDPGVPLRLTPALYNSDFCPKTGSEIGTRQPHELAQVIAYFVRVGGITDAEAAAADNTKKQRVLVADLLGYLSRY